MTGLTDQGAGVATFTVVSAIGDVAFVDEWRGKSVHALLRSNLLRIQGPWCIEVSSSAYSPISPYLGGGGEKTHLYPAGVWGSARINVLIALTPGDASPYSLRGSFQHG